MFIKRELAAQRQEQQTGKESRKARPVCRNECHFCSALDSACENLLSQDYITLRRIVEAQRKQINNHPNKSYILG